MAKHHPFGGKPFSRVMMAVKKMLSPKGRFHSMCGCDYVWRSRSEVRPLFGTSSENEGDNNGKQVIVVSSLQ